MTIRRLEDIPSTEQLLSLGRSAEHQPWFALVLDSFGERLLESHSESRTEDCARLESLFAGTASALLEEGHSLPDPLLQILTDEFDPTTGDVEAAQAAWLWGIALGRATVQVQNRQELLVLVSAAESNVITREAFSSEAASLLQKKEPYLTRAMDEEVACFRVHPENYIFGGKDARVLVQWSAWKSRLPYEAFDLLGIDHVPFSCQVLEIIEHLRALDVNSYLEWLDLLHNPVVVESSISRSTFEESLLFLETAPSAYSESGNLWSSYVSPMLLNAQLDRVSNLFRSFKWPPNNRGEFEGVSEAAQAQMRYFVEVLSKRPDALQLTADWLVWLVRRMTTLDSWRAHPHRIAIKAIIEVFNASGSDPSSLLAKLPQHRRLSDDERKALQESGTGRVRSSATPATDFLVARLLVTQCGRSSVSDATSFEEFEDLLLERDSALSQKESDAVPTLRHKLIACSFPEQGASIEWKRLWAALETQRRRSLGATFTQDFSGLDTSVFLAAAGLGILDNDQGHRHFQADHLQLWDALYEALWFQILYLDSTVHAAEFRRLFVVLVGALPRYLDLTDTNSFQKLAEVFYSLGQDEELIIHSVAALHRSEVDQQTLQRVFTSAGTDIQAAVDRYAPTEQNDSRYPLEKFWPSAKPQCKNLFGM